MSWRFRLISGLAQSSTALSRCVSIWKGCPVGLCIKYKHIHLELALMTVLLFLMEPNLRVPLTDWQVNPGNALSAGSTGCWPIDCFIVKALTRDLVIRFKVRSIIPSRKAVGVN